MHIEIAQAVEFLGRLLQNKLDTAMISSFKEQLGDLLKQHFIDHWDPQQPYRGNGYRSISNFNGDLDPVIIKGLKCVIYVIICILIIEFSLPAC